MSQRVVLSFVRNDASTESYTVTAQLWQGNIQQFNLTGRLPSANEIRICYAQWQALYKALSEQLHSGSIMGTTHETEGLPEIEPGGLTHVSEEDFHNLCERLKRLINQWLRTESFSHVNEQLRTHLELNKEILVAIQTDDELLWRLPWHLWNLFDVYRQAEIVLSNLEFIAINRAEDRSKNLVKVLVILGDDTGISLKEDEKLWQDLAEHYAKPEFLPKPQKSEIVAKLWEHNGWDILFFGGHGPRSEYLPCHSGEFAHNTSIFYINTEPPPANSVTIGQLEKAIKQARDRGLKLAIMNCCNGINLARHLLKLNFPRVIVMREDIPNHVAQEFLKYLLTGFSSGLSLPIAIRQAREKLESLEHEFPCASWLPVLCQNSAAASLTWEMMGGKAKPSIIDRLQYWISDILPEKLFRCRFWLVAIAVALVLILASIVINNLNRNPQLSVSPLVSPKPISSSLKACDLKSDDNLPLSCGEKALIDPRDRPPQEKKHKGIEAIANNKYDQAVPLLQDAWNDNKDPETLIYLNNARIMKEGIEEPNIFTLSVVVPYKGNQEFITKDMLMGVAWLQDLENKRIHPWKLRILIADDANNMSTAQSIARELVKRRDILAVVGSYSSHLTGNVIKIYQDNKLVLISPSSTFTLEALQASVPGITNLDFFFRPVSNTNIPAKKLAEYLNKKGYQKFIIFYIDGKLFSKSFFISFQSEVSKDKIVGKIDLNKNKLEITDLVKKMKTRFDNAKTTTALVMFPDANTTYNEPNNKLEVIKENNGDFLVAGSNTLYLDEILQLGKERLKKMVVTIPLYPSERDNKEFHAFWGNEQKLTWRTEMSYDSVQMFVEALSRQLKSNTPTRIGIRDALADPTFKTEGLTGKITLNGSDRREEFATLIEPICQLGTCEWREIKD